MAAAPPLSKAEYLKRYLSRADAGADGGPESCRKRRRKRPKPGGAGGQGMRIVDDDVSWTCISTTKPEKEEEDDGDLPVVAEFVDERPEDIKQMEAFRSSAKWKLLGSHGEDLSSPRHLRHDTPDFSPPRRARHDTPDPSPPRRARHDTPDSSPPRRARHDTPDPSPPRRARHDTPDPSPPRRARHDTPDPSPPRRARHDTPDSSPPRRARHDTPDPSPPRRARHDTPDPSPPRRARHDTPDPSPPRRARHDTPDSSPPRRARHDTPDPSPPRRARHDTPDPSPPRRARHDAPDSSRPRRARHDTLDPSPPRRARHDTPDPSPPRRARHDAPDSSRPRRARHDTPDPSPPRRARHDTPDPSLLRKPHRHPSGISPRRAHHDTPDLCPPRGAHHSSSDLSPSGRARNSPPDPAQPRRTLGPSDASQLRRACRDSSSLAPEEPHSLPRNKSSKAPGRASSRACAHWQGPGRSPPSLSKNSKRDYDLGLSPPRKTQAKSHFGSKQPDSKGSSPSHRTFHISSSPRRCQSHTMDSSYPSGSWKVSDSDLSPPRNRPRPQTSDSDLSPPRRKQRAGSSDSDLSPPRRNQPPGKKAAHMYSGAKTGLVLTDIQQEQQELKKRDQEIAFEDEFQFAETIFRDKSGRKRNLKLERLEQRRKAEKDSERDELYAQWGKGLAQSRLQQQNVEDAIKEMQKPLARYIDDEDLDRMLREQEREGDPMADFIKKNKAKENKNKKVSPRYSGPAPPPNRFNIWPGYRWDGVDSCLLMLFLALLL
ncbi:BUD13 homolog isoform X3 [Manis javanica]|uniref:BUD13 homolog isoform X3 n=1 Tax=Manis javanica TaxID=9974 RepID=UPI003C6D6227